MKAPTVAILFLLISIFASAQTAAQPSTGSFQAEGILKTIKNARVTADGSALRIARLNTSEPVRLEFLRSQAVGVDFSEDQWWVLPLGATGERISANRAVWVLPADPASHDGSWHIEFENGTVSVSSSEPGLTVLLQCDEARLTRAEARPQNDPFGRRFEIRLEDGEQMEEALAAFYWGTILPSVVERTMAAHFPYSSGYVLSTLNTHAYAGSYPAVDHEFQIKGRLAMGSAVDLAVVRRMIELQFKLMNDDPEHLYRAPCSVQPDGRREYHIRRNSEDNRTNAAMFLVTGNIEVLEEAWHYYEASKDKDWLHAHIEDLEHAASWIVANTDQYGRVWGDVYYEDQVMKDGRETEEQAFAARAFALLAGMERTLQRDVDAANDEALSKKMARVLAEPLPTGYWDEKAGRFIDWVDRNGEVHDHIHLLANELPVMLGYATAAQATAVRSTIAAHDAEFERFPSFLSPEIAAYSRSEIGSGGPYDLSAAGRYWYWDAAYRASERDNALLRGQLDAVAAEGAKSGYMMGERYDMDHVYYIDGKDAHGAEKYYEYPNVYAAVLIGQYVGLSVPADADVAVTPRIAGYGSVEFDTAAYNLRYEYSESGFTLTNLAAKARRFDVDLSGLGKAGGQFKQEGADGPHAAGLHFAVTIPAGGAARWTLEGNGPTQ